MTVWLVRIWTYKNADEKAHIFSRRSKNVKKRMKTYEKRILCKFTFKLQRWSRGHKARGQGQGHKKKSEAKAKDSLSEDRHSRGQGQGPRTQAQALSKKKRSSQKFFKRSPQKNVFQNIFQVLHKILTIQKIVLSPSRGQANFRGLEASRPRPRT